MSKAAELAALIGSQTALSNRNLIINGAMQVWQRGTTADTATSGDYMCDRFLVGFVGLDGNVDWDKETSSTPDGFSCALKVSTDASESSLDAGDFLRIEHRLEGQNLQLLQKGASSAKSVTLSFWVKSSVASTYTVALEDRDTASFREIGKSYTINSADTWEHKAVTFEGDTVGALDNDNAYSLGLYFWIDAGSTYTSGTFSSSWQARDTDERVYDTTGWLESTSPEFYITGVQLEVGEQDTPFEHRSMGDELARCQRYFFNPMAGGNGQSAQITFHSMLNIGGAVSTGNNGHLAFHVPFPVSMRAAPTLTHDLANTKINVGAPSGTQVAFYIQNQGYRDKAGNGNLNTLSRSTNTSAGCIVGTYYISPNALAGDQIQIGASNQFHFSAEL